MNRSFQNEAFTECRKLVWFHVKMFHFFFATIGSKERLYMVSTFRNNYVEGIDTLKIYVEISLIYRHIKKHCWWKEKKKRIPSFFTSTLLGSIFLIIWWKILLDLIKTGLPKSSKIHRFIILDFLNLFFVIIYFFDDSLMMKWWQLQPL